MHEEPESAWDHHMNINGKGTYNISHAVIPQMIKQGTGGSIVNVSSLSGIRVLKGVSTYNASKWAVTGFTKAIAVEYGEYGIRSNCICPNFMETGMTKQYFADESFVKGIIEKTPLRRIQTTKDLANMAIFLCSDDASIITATAIPVDGGIAEYIG